jgi:capsule polysaccharide export protein KpsE/RkpR
MVSYHGAWQLPLLYQSFELTDKKSYPPSKASYNKESVMGFLQSTPGYSIMTYILQLASVDKKVDNSLFNSTLLVVSDENYYKDFKDDFVMSLDRSAATGIVDYSTVIRILNIASLKTRMASKIDTKDRRNGIYVVNRGDTMFLNDHIRVLGERRCSNGNIIFVDGLLQPPTLRF